jgi:hypothetical protein
MIQKENFIFYFTHFESTRCQGNTDHKNGHRGKEMQEHVFVDKPLADNGVPSKEKRRVRPWWWKDEDKEKGK